MQRRSIFILSAMLLASLFPAVAGQITLVNGTHLAVLAVQAKSHGNIAWGRDLLDDNTLGIGKSRRVALPVGVSCDADFLATLDDGHKLVIPADNVCRNSAVAVTDNR
jgi:hypothetical protein